MYENNLFGALTMQDWVDFDELYNDIPAAELKENIYQFM